MDIFTLKNTLGLTVRYSPKTCELSLEFADKTVNFSNEKPFIELFAFGKNFRLELTLARKIHIEEMQTSVGAGIRTVYEDFYAYGKKLSISADTFVSINNNDNFISFEIDVKNGENSEIERIIWPQPVEFNDSDDSAYTVIPSLQGALIPSRWHNTFMLYSNGRYNECDCCMPWWGQYFNGVGYISVADTPWDGGFNLQHIPGKKTRISSCWYPSLRKMGYRRKQKILFAENLNYNSMCRTYRRLMTENGSFVSLEEKVRRKPKTLNYIGVPFISDYMLVSSDETSPRYDGNPLFYTTARERAQQLANLKKLGLEKASVHFDGCNRFGYDNGHPDIFPPSELIGGIDGVKFLLNECRRLGYTLNLHDQYHDYYVNSPSYNPVLAIEDSDNNIIKESVNYGGTQTFLCPENIMPFLKRNYDLFQKSDIIVDGIHLGAFSGAPIDECYSPIHPISRRECIEKRREAFRYLTSKGYVVSSDEPVDCMIGEIDLVAQATYSLIPSMANGISNGVSVPLFNMVYHDAVIMPWCMPFENVSWWGIPNTDSPYTHAFLNASPFGLSMPDEHRIKALLPKLNKLCLLHKKLAFTPMIKHEFSENNPRIQRTYFEDGSIIEVDFDSDRTDVISAPHSSSNIIFPMSVH